LDPLLAIAYFAQTIDNTLARKFLGFEPQYTYEETLDIIVQEHLKSKEHSR
jgi:nucleoside-diphosphate-sugar epimerase